MTPLKRFMRGECGVNILVDGYLGHDIASFSPCQLLCMERLYFTLGLEQESYLVRHPEIPAMLKTFLVQELQRHSRQTILSDSWNFFVKPAAELDKDIRRLLKLPPDVPYTENTKKEWHYEDNELLTDLKNIVRNVYPDKIPTRYSSEAPTPITESSSFLSFRTSESTLPTPEAIPTPPLTVYEVFFNMVSNAVDKAIYSRVTDDDIKYDTAYVELVNAVEVAMEIPVIGVREDIAAILALSSWLFEKVLDEKDRLAAEIAWKKRMRKKLKRTLRRQKNFKGFETPPTPKSTISSHESYKIPPPRPCICHPQFTYNRYPKDRFGIYLPQEKRFSTENLTVVDFPSEKSDKSDDDTGSVKSNATNKSNVTNKSGATNKSNATSGATSKFSAATRSGASNRSGATSRGTTATDASD